MPTKPDPLDNLSPEGRIKLFHDVIFGMFGEERGAQMWPQIEAGLRMTDRQIGDALDPEKNYWRGAWKIYEIE